MCSDVKRIMTFKYDLFAESAIIDRIQNSHFIFRSAVYICQQSFLSTSNHLWGCCCATSICKSAQIFVLHLGLTMKLYSFSLSLYQKWKVINSELYFKVLPS